MGSRLNVTVAEDLEASAVGFITDLDGWWDDFHGQFSAGIDFLASAIGRRAREMSGHADSVEAAYATADDEIEGLTTASGALLNDAEEMLAERAGAASAHDTWAGHAEEARAERNRHEHGSEERQRWHASYVSAKGVRDGFAATRDDATAALDAMQIDFEVLRDEETAAHQAFADTLGGLDVAATALEIDISATEAASVGLLITLLDARLLSLPGTKQSAATAGLVKSARDTLAALAGIDLDEHDRRVAIVQAKREIERLGHDALAQRISDALEAGDEAELQRLADLLALGLLGMSDDDREATLAELKYLLTTFGDGSAPLVNLFVTYDGELPTWVALLVFDLAEHETYFINDPETARLIADRLGLDWTDSDFYEQVQDILFTRIAGSDAWPAVIESIADGSIDPPESELLDGLLVDWFTLHPEDLSKFVRRAEAGDPGEIGRILDVIAESASDDELDEIMTILMEHEVPDTGIDSVEGIRDWNRFARRLGVLQAGFDNVGHGASYDFSSVLEFAVGAGASAVNPAAGTAVSAGFAILDGYAADPVPAHWGEAERRNRLAFTIAVTAVLSDPTLNEDLAAELIALGDDGDAIDAFIDAGGDLYDQVSDFAEAFGYSRAHNGIN